MIQIREATDADVENIRDLFVEVYGYEYPFKEFYDTKWLKKAVFDEGTLVLVMEAGERIIATAQIIFTSGGMDDMIGEVGRLVATTDPDYHGKGLYSRLIKELVTRTRDRILFLWGEARTVHRASQHIAEELGWVPIGFEPMKYLLLGKRESMSVYAKTQGLAQELRKNNPHVIAEASVLAQTVLKNMGYPIDIIIEDEINGYPTDEEFAIEHLDEQHGITSLLRIERGRVSRKEIFGNFSLSQGFFRIHDPTTSYLIARNGDAILGAVGFSYDAIDKKIRIFELIEFDDAVKGALLSRLDHVARTTLDVDYIEVDVSAYSPKIQRTFERLGFIPIAYCPSMVFDKVERLDVIRMAKLYCPYDLGQIKLLEPAEQIRQIVEKGMENRLIGMEITEEVRKTDLFCHLPDGDLYYLARFSSRRNYEAGTQIIMAGEQPKYLYILTQGEAEIVRDGEVLSVYHNGNIIGGMALLNPKLPRDADVVFTKPSTVIVMEITQLNHLLQAYPRLGYTVAINLARSLTCVMHRFWL